MRSRVGFRRASFVQLAENILNSVASILLLYDVVSLGIWFLSAGLQCLQNMGHHMPNDTDSYLRGRIFSSVTVRVSNLTSNSF